MFELLNHVALLGTLFFCVYLFLMQRKSINDSLRDMRTFLNNIDCTIKRHQVDYIETSKSLNSISSYVSKLEEKARQTPPPPPKKSVAKKK